MTIDDAYKRLERRNLQLLAALGAIRDTAEGASGSRAGENYLLAAFSEIREVCDEQAKMGWADAELEEPLRPPWLDPEDAAEPWRDLVRSLIAHDARCESPFCSTTMLGASA